jgi:hypothetical protein
MKALLLCLPFCLIIISMGEPAAAAEPFGQLQPFLTKYCNDCHAEGAEEGGLDLGKLRNGLTDAATFTRWERLYDRVRTGEMPPEAADQPSATERQQFLHLLEDPLIAAHARTRGTVLRRLNRREYQNTMNDIFGTQLDLEGMLPEDSRSHEFDNVGESLGISLVHLQKYMEAADKVLDAAIAQTVEAPEKKTHRIELQGHARRGKLHR